MEKVEEFEPGQDSYLEVQSNFKIIFETIFDQFFTVNR